MNRNHRDQKHDIFSHLFEGFECAKNELFSHTLNTANYYYSEYSTHTKKLIIFRTHHKIGQLCGTNM